jgi:hypothetical protein
VTTNRGNRKWLLPEKITQAILPMIQNALLKRVRKAVNTAMAAGVSPTTQAPRAEADRATVAAETLPMTRRRHRKPAKREDKRVVGVAVDVSLDVVV